MKTKRTRFISFICSFALLFSLLPTAAFAANPCGDGCFVVEGITYLPISGTTNEVEVVNPGFHPVNGATVSTYTGNVSIPATVGYNNTNYSVTKIGDNAFSRTTSDPQVTSVKIAEGVKEIGESAFQGCSGLITLSLPSTITTIGAGAFGQCTGLTSLEIPAGVKNGLVQALTGGVYGGSNTFYPYNFPYSGTSGKGIKFAQGSSYEFVTATDGTNTANLLYNGTFLDGVLRTYTQNGNVITGDEITSLTIREGTTEIGPSAMASLESLKTVKMPTGGTLKTIGYDAFDGCTTLTSIDLSSVETIGAMAFCGTALTSANLSSLKTLETITVDGYELSMAFWGCDSLTTVLFGNVDKIPADAFSDSEDEAGLTFVMLETTPPTFGNGFSMNNLTVIIPAGSKEAYENSALGSYIQTDAGETKPGITYGLTLENTTLTEGNTYTPTITIPTGASVEVSSNNANAATAKYDNGVLTVTGVKAGSATITASITLNNVTLVSKECTVTVTAAPVPATSITLNQNGLFLYSNTTPNTATLTATVEPANSTDTVSWSSSNNDVVTVENGVVKAVGNGTATIMATAGSCSATCEVTVTRYSSGGGTVTPTYSVTTPAADNGTVTVSPKNASKGTTVTITVKPDDGYELDELIVTDKNGDELKLTDKGNGKFTFTMPGSKVEIEASFVEIEEPIVVPEFTDVPADAYYADAVEWAVKNGITIGTGDGTTFSPDLGCTRAQVVTFLWRAAGSPAPKSTVNPFVDVLPGEYYAEAVLWAVENGITVGTNAEGTTFSPDEICSRAQIVTFLWRSENRPAASTSGSFVDVASDTYYTGAVEWAAENAITVGTNPEGTMFSPDEDCTRAQIVTFLYRYMA